MRAISPAEMDRDTARQRQTAAESQRVQRLDHAWTVARRAAALLRSRFNARQIVVFDSLAHPELFLSGR